jgi:hypothetical protein
VLPLHIHPPTHPPTQPCRRCEAFRPRLPECSVQTASLGVWALGKLRWRPGAAWASAFLSGSLPLLPLAGPQELTAMAYGVSSIHAAPDAAWLGAFRRQCSAQLQGFTQAELAQMLSALVAVQGLDYRDPALRAWLGRLTQQQRPHLDECSAAELSLLLAALARARYKPPAAWLERFEAAALARLQAFSCRALCQVIWAYAQFGPNVNFGFLHECLHALTVQLDCSNGQDLSSVVYAMGKMRLRPKRAWVAAFLVNCRSKMGLLAPHQLVHVLWGLAQLDVVPPTEWLRGYVRAARPALAQLPALELRRLRDALQRMEMDPQPDWLFDFSEHVEGLAAAAVAKGAAEGGAG